MGYLSVPSHRAMVLDQRRNEFYRDALKKVITKDSIVLDLGAGLGILGFIAAKLGAKKVYLVEPQDIINVAMEVAKTSDLTDRVQFFRGKIEDIELPESVDVIVSVFTGNFLLNEDLLPSLFFARDKYLKSDGVMIPDNAVMFAVPVHLPEVYEKEIGVWSETHMDIDFSAVMSYASNTVFYNSEENSQAQYLATPMALLEMDLLTSRDVKCDIEQSYTITKEGDCHGWVGWFDMQLGDKWLSTAPHEPEVHWAPAFLPLYPPIKLEVGDEILFRLNRPLFGDWSWTVEMPDTKQQHSTFLATPMSLDTIKKASLKYQPKINEDGQIIQLILSLADGTNSVTQITEQVQNKYPNKYLNPKEAMNFVQGIIKWYG